MNEVLAEVDGAITSLRFTHVPQSNGVPKYGSIEVAIAFADQEPTRPGCHLVLPTAHAKTLRVGQTVRVVIEQREVEGHS